MLVSCLDTKSELLISEASISLSPLSSLPSAGYMTIRNLSDQKITISKVSSPHFHEVQWHKTVMRNGIAKMRLITRPTIHPGQVVKLERGGGHLMLLDPKQSLEEGNDVDLIFELQNMDAIRIKARLVASWGSPKQNHQHQH